PRQMGHAVPDRSRLHQPCPHRRGIRRDRRTASRGGSLRVAGEGTRGRVSLAAACLPPRLQRSGLPLYHSAMPGYGARYWADRTPPSKRPKYPVCRGELTADVVVIGGGLTGAIAACVLARGGLDVVVVDAERVVSGSTAAGFGAVVPQPAASFAAM